MNRLKERYVAEIAPALNKKFGYKSVMQIPKLDKVIVNVGCGDSKNNAKEIEAICKDITTITGQKPVIFALLCSSLIRCGFQQLCLYLHLLYYLDLVLNSFL